MTVYNMLWVFFSRHTAPEIKSWTIFSSLIHPATWIRRLLVLLICHIHIQIIWHLFCRFDTITLVFVLYAKVCFMCVFFS